MIGKCINITIYIITNNTTRLNIRNLFDNNLLLNFEHEKNNRSINKGNNIIFEEKLVKIHTNFQHDIHNPPISIDPYPDLTLSSPNPTII